MGTAAISQLTAISYFQNAELDYKEIYPEKIAGWLIKKGIPAEIVNRLLDLWDNSKKIGSTLICWGKVLICKLIEFIRAYPNMAAGLALGAAIVWLIDMVPFLGPMLTPILAPFAVIIPAIHGFKLDTHADNIMDAAIILVQKFFQEIAHMLKLIVS